MQTIFGVVFCWGTLKTEDQQATTEAVDERSLATAMTLFASNTMRGIQSWRSSPRSVQSNRRATNVFQTFRSLLLHLKPGWMKAPVHMRLTEKSRIKRSVVCAGRLGPCRPLTPDSWCVHLCAFSMHQSRVFLSLSARVQFPGVPVCGFFSVF